MRKIKQSFFLGPSPKRSIRQVNHDLGPCLHVISKLYFSRVSLCLQASVCSFNLTRSRPTMIMLFWIYFQFSLVQLISVQFSSLNFNIGQLVSSHNFYSVQLISTQFNPIQSKKTRPVCPPTQSCVGLVRLVNLS